MPIECHLMAICASWYESPLHVLLNLPLLLILGLQLPGVFSWPFGLEHVYNLKGDQPRSGMRDAGAVSDLCSMTAVPTLHNRIVPANSPLRWQFIHWDTGLLCLTQRTMHQVASSDANSCCKYLAGEYDQSSFIHNAASLSHTPKTLNPV